MTKETEDYDGNVGCDMLFASALFMCVVLVWGAYFLINFFMNLAGK